MLVDKKAFSKLSVTDQKIVRDVMEGIYRKFDQNGFIDNREALQALQDNGLQKVSPDLTNIEQWRAIVFRSHVQMAQDGAFDMALLDQMQALIKEFRNGTADTAP